MGKKPRAVDASTIVHEKRTRGSPLFLTLPRCFCGGERQHHLTLLIGTSKKFRFKNKLMSLDGSIIDLSVSMFDWAKFRRTKGAIKLHLLLDHDGYLPSFAVVTEGKTSEIKVARTLRFAPGTILAIDRGYIDYEWFRELTQEEVYFVTRMKEKAVYEVQEELQIPQNSNVVRDQIICFPRLAREGEEPVLFRRVEIWDAEKEEAIVFLSNLLAFGATTIAAIYKDRWEVELFFKALKQLCKIKTFVGTSANAVRTQVWTALIAMLVLKYLQLKSKFSWSLSTLAALLRQQLFFYRDLWVWLDDPFQAPPALAGVHDDAQQQRSRHRLALLGKPFGQRPQCLCSQPLFRHSLSRLMSKLKSAASS